MKSEYDLDYSKAKPNRFAGVVKEKVILYPIDEDVAKVFRNPAEANNALRAIINALPKKSVKKQLSITPQLLDLNKKQGTRNRQLVTGGLMNQFIFFTTIKTALFSFLIIKLHDKRLETKG